MSTTSRVVVTLAVTGALVAGFAAAATASPGSGDGPLTAVTGTYRVVTDEVPGPWAWAEPADDVAFRLYPGSRVEVKDAGGSCVQPATQEVRYSDGGHHATCDSLDPETAAPVVTEAWAR